jgi:hypothetical protein
MISQERTGLIKQYKDGYNEVLDALHEISTEELDFRPRSGKWSAREIVHHLADSEMTSAIRLRRLLVEYHPYIQGYDEDQFAEKLHYGSRPIDAALKVFESSRATTAELLDLMTEQEWKRTGEHSDSGPYSPEVWLSIYAVHAHNHANQIRRNRATYKESK